MSTPPNPWKVDELARWFDRTSSFSYPGILFNDKEDIDGAILDDAEKAFKELSEPSTRRLELDCGCLTRQTNGGNRFPISPGQPSHADLEITVNDKVSESLRQMMLLPVFHTEYRQFLVLHDRDPPNILETRRRLPTQRIKDLVSP
jgi:hypothetical protein